MSNDNSLSKMDTKTGKKRLSIKHPSKKKIQSHRELPPMAVNFSLQFESKNPLLRNEKHEYYLRDLKVCVLESEYLDAGACLDGGQKSFTFMDHFEENFSFFKHSHQYKPYSGQSLDEKKLGEVVLLDLFTNAKQHNGRVLLIDLDETLVHADYVGLNQESTFELGMNGRA